MHPLRDGTGGVAMTAAQLVGAVANALIIALTVAVIVTGWWHILTLGDN